MTNCKNCGAVLKNNVCEYCGADYREAPENETVKLYADGKCIYEYSVSAKEYAKGLDKFRRLL